MVHRDIQKTGEVIMQKRIVFRGMEHSATIEEHAQEQLKKIEKFLGSEPEPIFIDIVFEAHPTHAHDKVEVRIKSPNYHAIVSRKEGPDLYKLVDVALDIAYDELLKQKERLVDSHKKGCVRDCSLLHEKSESDDDSELEINNFDNEFEFDLLEEQYDTVEEPKRNRISLPSGLEYEVIYEPVKTALVPREGQTVTIQYAAWLNDNGAPGKKIVLDHHAEKLTFVVGNDQIIKGLDDAVLTMRMGEQRRLFIPAHLGYGKKGLERMVPPNVPLIFDVELLKID